MYTQANAQKTRAINNKGTLIEINNNTVTTAATAPTSPNIDGDIWFDTTLNIPKIWDTQNWKELMKLRFGDIKYGLQGTDHNGWVILNGRTISSLPTTQQVQAMALGFSGNLPNAEDKVLMMRSTGSIADIGGNTAIQILQENLPNVTFTGTTSTDGDHTHTGSDVHAGANDRKGNTSWNFRSGNTTATRTTSTAGNHSHNASAPSGGSDAPIVFTPTYVYVNVFIFLGN